MAAIDLLEQIGLNKYEAEAYYTLLVEGPSTGYEVGKRSAIPLSRSYDTLERLTQRGLALVQPGDPPRYAAQDPAQFLGQVRSAFIGTLDTLSHALAELPRRDADGELWVLRRRQHVLARVQTMIDAARDTVALDLAADADADVTDALARARARGRHVVGLPIRTPSDAATILLLVDDRTVMVGTLAPADRCQAVVTTNVALVAAVKGYFSNQRNVQKAVPASPSADTSHHDPLDWLAWEERKQRRLQQRADDDRVA